MFLKHCDFGTSRNELSFLSGFFEFLEPNPKPNPKTQPDSFLTSVIIHRLIPNFVP